MRTRNLIIFAMLSALMAFASFSEYGTSCQAQETEFYPVRVNGKEGYVDAMGRVVIKPQFDEVGTEFSEGLARIRVGEKWGYIDKTGKIVISPQFDYAFGFSEGLAAVISGRCGYIDKSGRIVINPQFDMAWSFSEGLARVEIGDRVGYIDRTVRYVIGLRFSQFFFI